MILTRRFKDIMNQNHQKETYQHTGSSQYQSSSSRTIQPDDAGLSDGNYAN
ncbi:hypothetical protein PPACK8108_LOCUS1667 [Phakopsora pachyrhizi]|uniref:Uncharacterized protein n=1 Tax=Phakopsora pachyrhizi TaxID=170000 RepID=A0AAV0AJ17_PHAPC|nr:hypothetical protein PPACK8108_LOCUS1667 [Phakopsora pachyrhizi]